MSRRSKPHLARFANPFLLALGILADGMAPPAFAATQPSTSPQLPPPLPPQGW